jgi:copper resistance protein B
VKASGIAALLLGVSCVAANAAEPAGRTLAVGDAAAPPVARDNAADRLFDPAKMQRARAILAEEHGGAPVSKLMANIAELSSSPEGGGYRWDAEAWYGGDLNRLVIRTEGEGLRRSPLAAAEVQALYSRAVGRYTDLQAGVRQEFQPDGRTYATLAIEALLPYWLEAEAALFVSDRGDVFSRLEGHYDLRLTQRLILQPRAEVSYAAQDVPDVDIGSGISSVEFGLRLRYDIRREFSPYVGVNFARSVGRTADLVRAAGHDADDTTLVLGLRGWF